ncbi:hypothetical protein GCM10010302_75660 [Streptomyces polychromogenes]|uniref:Uncharacterized protein n=1 Tax=Streptomyces polychromogenes TaxID=67342 RepID=A0ABN0W5S9_9ACTN
MTGACVSSLITPSCPPGRTPRAETASPLRQRRHWVTTQVERQSATLRELSRRAFPETDVTADDAPAPTSRPARSAAARLR